MTTTDLQNIILLKDAEIERLKGVCKDQLEAIELLAAAGERKDKLITELADMLDTQPGLIDPDFDKIGALIQKARESVK